MVGWMDEMIATDHNLPRYLSGKLLFFRYEVARKMHGHVRKTGCVVLAEEASDVKKMWQRRRFAVQNSPPDGGDWRMRLVGLWAYGRKRSTVLCIIVRKASV